MNFLDECIDPINNTGHSKYNVNNPFRNCWAPNYNKLEIYSFKKEKEKNYKPDDPARSATSKKEKKVRISRKEAAITERIFMLQISLRLLSAGRTPFHEEAKSIIRKHIMELKR